MRSVPLEKAIRIFGSAAALARELGVTPMAVSLWKANGVPVRRAKEIQKITQNRVTAQELRPDIFDKDVLDSIR